MSGSNNYETAAPLPPPSRPPRGRGPSPPTTSASSPGDKGDCRRHPQPATTTLVAACLGNRTRPSRPLLPVRAAQVFVASSGRVLRRRRAPTTEEYSASGIRL